MICRTISKLPLQFDRFTLLNLVVNKTTNTTQLNQIHALLILNGHRNDIIAATKLTQKLSALNSVHQARILCFTFPNPDIFLFNALIRAYAGNNTDSHLSALSVYNHVRKRTKLEANNFTYAFALSACSRLSDERYGVLLHAHCLVDGFGEDVFIGSSLVDFYFKFSKVDSAQKVFDGMCERDTVLWNTVVSGLVRNCRYETAVRVFGDMVIEGRSRLDSTSLAAVLPAAAEMQDLRFGMVVHCLGLRTGHQSHVHVLTALISLYSRCGMINEARLLFGDIVNPDLISFNAMISGYTCNNEIGFAIEMVRELMNLGERINSSTVVGLIPVHFPFGHLDLTRSVHGFSLKSGLILSPSVSTAVLTVYTKLNEMDSARMLFDDTVVKSVASWNAMISGYAQNGLTEMAISLFRQMQMSEVRPNPVTVTSILSSCAQLGTLSLGKWVHDVIKKESFETNIYVSTALIDMYAKCGSISEARNIFDKMSDKNEVTWNAMVSGYGLHGDGHEALKLFKEMSCYGVSLTNVTFLSVLYACSHSGLVEEGKQVFHSMVHDHGFDPMVEHYACMVDILGRAGHVDKALDFIRSMPVEPGPAVWGTLLGACKTHKNIDIARLASNKLFELDSDSVGFYVLLSNIYSTDKNYPKAASVREIVKKKKLTKTPGCTLIEVNDTPHTFTAGDRSHPQSKAIYLMLEKLMGKMGDAGFKTETVTSLHDVEEEDKELNVTVHSEKLAIAFGLIATKPGTEIMIIKNLRVCLDCHNATKFISKITERVIVVRDANRFHHFKDGVCSCGDYW